MENRFYIARTEDAADLPLPAYMSEGAAGMDLYANVKEEVTVEKGSIKLIPTGIRIALLRGFGVPIHGLFIILCHAYTFVIAIAQFLLTGIIALLGGSRPPIYGI